MKSILQVYQLPVNSVLFYNTASHYSVLQIIISQFFNAREMLSAELNTSLSDTLIITDKVHTTFFKVHIISVQLKCYDQETQSPTLMWKHQYRCSIGNDRIQVFLQMSTLFWSTGVIIYFELACKEI